MEKVKITSKKVLTQFDKNDKIDITECDQEKHM